MCWACKKKFVGGSEDMAVRDHDHSINPILPRRSNFQGVAHKSCNVNVAQQYFLPVYMHNSSYDLKFILPALAHL